MAAPALEEAGAPGEGCVQVERRDRATGAFPQPVAAGDEDDRAVIALDEARRDDADDALVPILAAQDVGTTVPLG